MEKMVDFILQYVEMDEEITEASTLKNDCGFSSFDLTCLYTDIFTYYGIKPECVNVKAIKTVGELKAAIDNNKTKN